MTYAETIEYLVGLEAVRGWDLKLERVRDALSHLGSPERAQPSILIAGTNGKGSTAALVHAALGAQGLRVGLYTSPHLVHFTERIRIGDDEIERNRVVADVARIRRIAPPEESGLTFFEVSTLLAFLAFAERAVDVAVLEVGLGGRLDATNVVEPIVSAIVSIGLDHQSYLGSTLPAIAREKAGVMRQGRAVVLGSGIPEDARSALEDEAQRVGARIVEAGTWEDRVPAVGLRGAHMRGNGAVALAILSEVAAVEPRLRASEAAVVRGFARAYWPALRGCASWPSTTCASNTAFPEGRARTPPVWRRGFSRSGRKRSPPWKWSRERAGSSTSTSTASSSSRSPCSVAIPIRTTSFRSSASEWPDPLRLRLSCAPE